MKRWMLLLLALWLPVSYGGEEDAPRTAVLGALDEEIALLQAEMKDGREEKAHGLVFYVGRLGGRPAVLTRCGVGKVNAAMVSALLVARYAPREVLFTGIAGSIHPDLRPGDIVIGERTVQHDCGLVSAQGLDVMPTRRIGSREPNPLHVPSDPDLVALAEAAAKTAELEKIPMEGEPRLPRVVKGTIATGDVFVASSEKKAWLRKAVGADAVEMEGAAVAQVCLHLQVPLLVVRSISDSADESARVDIRKFRQVAAGNSARLTLRILEQFQKRQAAKPGR